MIYNLVLTSGSIVVTCSSDSWLVYHNLKVVGSNLTRVKVTSSQCKYMFLCGMWGASTISTTRSLNIRLHQAFLIALRNFMSACFLCWDFNQFLNNCPQKAEWWLYPQISSKMWCVPDSTDLQVYQTRTNQEFDRGYSFARKIFLSMAIGQLKNQ